jgi:hypothetical protein
LIGLPQTDDADHVAPNGEVHGVETAIERREGSEAAFAVLKAEIFKNDCAVEVDFRCRRERNPMVCFSYIIVATKNGTGQQFVLLQ